MVGSVKHGMGKSGKGRRTAQCILEAAAELLIDEGYHSFSLHKVSARAGLTIGNLQYYFPTKDTLIAAMLDETIGEYLKRFEQIRDSTGPDPIEQFKALIEMIIRDLNRKRTTVFFPELWALANHHVHAVDLMDDMYEKYRHVLVEVMRLINPTLSDAQLHRLALFISCSIEGHTMFIGNGKRWIDETENIVAMAAKSFLWLVQSGEVPE